jgi:hypothetical protein
MLGDEQRISSSLRRKEEGHDAPEQHGDGSRTCMPGTGTALARPQILELAGGVAAGWCSTAAAPDGRAEPFVHLV